MSPARADATEVNITGLVASFILQAHLLPAVHFCLFVLVGRIPLVSRGGEVGTLPTSPQTGLPSSRPHLVAEQPEGPAGSRALPTA